jgi:hypothetical protein
MFLEAAAGTGTGAGAGTGSGRRSRRRRRGFIRARLVVVVVADGEGEKSTGCWSGPGRLLPAAEAAGLEERRSLYLDGVRRHRWIWTDGWMDG